MRMKELRELERQIKTVEAAERLERDYVKGVTVQVIFDSPARGGQDANVQVFFADGTDECATILGVVQGKVAESKADAEGKLNAAKAKFARE